MGLERAHVQHRGVRGAASELALPLWSSYLVRVYAWKLILAKEGVISWAFAATHLASLLNGMLALPVIGGPSLSGVVSRLFLVFTYLAAVHDPAAKGG